MKNNEPLLLIEDDVVDVLTAERAFDAINVKNKFYHVKNGDEALDFLNDDKQPTPGLILLDLNMPGMSGLEFLEVRFKSVKLRSIPLVVLTTSSDTNDISRSFELAISGYMVKPVDYHEFVDLMKKVLDYWLSSESPN